MEKCPAVGVGLEYETSANPHTQDKLLTLLSVTSLYISNIKTNTDADIILKESLESNFKTINELLTSAITEGITMDAVGEIQLSESPIRLAMDYVENVYCMVCMM